MRVLFLLGLAAAAVLVCVGEPVLAESHVLESEVIEGKNWRLHAVQHANHHLLEQSWILTISIFLPTNPEAIYTSTFELSARTKKPSHSPTNRPSRAKPKIPTQKPTTTRAPSIAPYDLLPPYQKQHSTGGGKQIPVPPSVLPPMRK